MPHGLDPNDVVKATFLTRLDIHGKMQLSTDWRLWS
jgi:hypothetical protein